LLACQRIIADKRTIQEFFEEDNSLFVLLSLQQIESSGSDFHKGGKQVLILHFNTLFGPFKLVYKPSDVEIDCLITGDARAIRKVIPDFMMESLVEIFNKLVREQKGAHPHALPLPTYKILPFRRMSTEPPANPPFAAVPQLYGYIEYLKDDATYWPSSANYTTLFTSTEDKRHITNFYQQTGEWLALACTFSLMDLHLQNVRVRAYQPHLIDLEASLGEYIEEVKSTLLLDPPLNVYGGINGYE